MSEELAPAFNSTKPDGKLDFPFLYVPDTNKQRPTIKLGASGNGRNVFIDKNGEELKDAP